MVKASTLAEVDALIGRYPALKVCEADLRAAVEMICESYAGGHKLIACGNGGSASDAEHIVGELMKGFLLPRKLGRDMARKMEEVCPEEKEYFLENLQGALPALSLVNQVALNTAFANVTIRVPDDETFRIQEFHLPVYHMLCIAAENEFFGED